jgi:acetylornithine deacetylase
MSKDTCAQLVDTVHEHEEQYIDLLEESLNRSDDVDTYQRWISEYLEARGLSVETFELDREYIATQPSYRRTLEHSPATLNSNPNVVGTLSGDGNGDSTLLYAHADKSPFAYQSTTDGPVRRGDGDRLAGPGIADDVAGVSSILGVIDVLGRSDVDIPGDVIVGSVMGKQLGVLGTYGLVRKYGPADSAVYVHPAESEAGLGDLKVGSNGLIEFVIEIDGRAPDTTEPAHNLFADPGANPIRKGHKLLNELHQWASEASMEYEYEPLEALADRSVGMLVSSVTSGLGNSPTTVPDSCTVRGSVSFPPTVSLTAFKTEFRAAFRRSIERDDSLSDSNSRLTWGDHMVDSASTPPHAQFVQDTADVVETVSGERPSAYHGHTASDIRYPILHWDAETLGIGPRCGEIGTDDEWINRTEYLETIATVASMVAT